VQQFCRNSDNACHLAEPVAAKTIMVTGCLVSVCLSQQVVRTCSERWARCISIIPWFLHNKSRHTNKLLLMLWTTRCLVKILHSDCDHTSYSMFQNLIPHERKSVLHLMANLKKRNKNIWDELITYFPLIRYGQHKQRHLQQFFDFTDPLPSNGRRDTHTDTQTDGRDLWITALRWAQVPWYTYQITQRFVSAFRS
jgi:hypothetical protein